MKEAQHGVRTRKPTAKSNLYGMDVEASWHGRLEDVGAYCTQTQ